MIVFTARQAALRLSALMIAWGALAMPAHAAAPTYTLDSPPPAGASILYCVDTSSGPPYIASPCSPASTTNQTATQAVPGSDASKADAIQGVTGGKPIPVTASSYAASGKTPVASTFAATGQSASFTPLAGRAFNVSLWGTFAATVQLERSFDSGTTWLPLTAAGTQLYKWTAAASESAEEDETPVFYRLNCTAYTSGTVNYRVSQ